MTHNRRPDGTIIRINLLVTVRRDHRYETSVTAAWWRPSDAVGAGSRDQLRLTDTSWQRPVAALESWMGALAAERGHDELEYDVMGWEQLALELPGEENPPPFG